MSPKKLQDVTKDSLVKILSDIETFGSSRTCHEGVIILRDQLLHPENVDFRNEFDFQERHYNEVFAPLPLHNPEFSGVSR